MKVLYKQPYWIKYQWDLSYHDDHQYVTEFNKEDNYDVYTCFHKKRWSLNVSFNLIENSFTDPIFCIIGKPGKNMGITYNTETDSLAFEFWTQKRNEDDKFHWVGFYGINKEELLKDEILLTVVRNGQTIILYKNFEKVNEYEFDGEFIDDYKGEGILIGVGNPGTYVEQHRYFGQFDIHHLSFLQKTTSIETSKELYHTYIDQLLNKKFYKRLLFLFDFKYKNSYNIVLDESKNTNFMEKVPLEFTTNN